MMLEIMRVAWRSVKANKMRSFLTMLGIIIGVMAVVLSSAIGMSAKNGVTSRIESLGSNVLTIMPGSTSVGGVNQGYGSASTLTISNATAIQQDDPDVAMTAPLVSHSAQVVFGANNTNTAIEGTNQNYPAIKDVSMAQGSFFTSEDVSKAANVAVLGSQVEQTLFSGTGVNPVGQTIDIAGIPFTVIGVAASQGASGFQNENDAIAIPVTTEQNLLTGSDTVNEILASAKSANVMNQAQLEIESTLRVLHQLSPSTADDFQIINQATILSALSGVTQILTDLLDGISAISLLVGGIGIMNIMLVSVTERTREIGIRKAIGARRGVILTQFLLESLGLSLSGAVIGLLLGTAGALTVGAVSHTGNLLSPGAMILAVIFSILIGLVFGVYPARKAANLKPIDALRYE
ncbi:ABC transporter permease [Alicyclobacillus tengchongensis]|uniref:ABC transport system permease protein n=1 Tax=Alicyclobacillus tolerans TaxID=90970 RepID=A0ABT9LTY2_9BACL|nr:ABC transporter permease [Alicyclobacillus tengchongensis]MDP9727719.1 putative ABC transport system permease protein [Alicyclobacillus tengchongensis]